MVIDEISVELTFDPSALQAQVGDGIALLEKAGLVAALDALAKDFRGVCSYCGIDAEDHPALLAAERLVPREVEA